MGRISVWLCDLDDLGAGRYERSEIWRGGVGWGKLVVGNWWRPTKKARCVWDLQFRDTLVSHITLFLLL